MRNIIIISTLFIIIALPLSAQAVSEKSVQKVPFGKQCQQECAAIKAQIMHKKADIISLHGQQPVNQEAAIALAKEIIALKKSLRQKRAERRAIAQILRQCKQGKKNKRFQGRKQGKRMAKNKKRGFGRMQGKAGKCRLQGKKGRRKGFERRFQGQKNGKQGFGRRFQGQKNGRRGFKSCPKCNHCRQGKAKFRRKFAERFGF